MVVVGSIGLLAGHGIRARWRSTIAIALLIGIVGAIVLATAAGARRSGTALERFNAASLSSNVELSIAAPTKQQLADYRTSAGVEALSQLRAYAFTLEDVPNLAMAAPMDGAFGHHLDRSRLIAGRRADPSVAEEITIGESLSKLLDLPIGATFSTDSFTAEQIRDAFAGGTPGRPDGPRVKFRVVGIVRRPLDLGVRASAGGVVVLTPAFTDQYDGRIGAYTDVLRVKLKDGAAGVPRAVAAARRVFGNTLTFGAQPLGIETEGARSAIDVLTLALWIVAAVTALAGFVAIGIVLTREVSQSNLDQPTLRALGLTRGQRIAVNVPRAFLIAGVGGLLAGLGAVAISPLFPIGLARRADPDPGLHADGTVLALAIPLVVAVVAVIGLLAAVRSTRRSSYENIPHAYRRTSNVVERAAAAGLRPTATNGLRMAIQSGRGETAVPVRSAFAGAVLGVAGVTAALVFAASLNHLVATPRLYGWTFDVKGEVGTNLVCGDRRDHGLSKDRAIEAVAVVCPTSIQIDGRPVNAWGFRSLKGTIDPEVVSGRAPRGPGEIALGSVTLNALHKGIGDTVRARGTGKTRSYVIVGRIVLPTIGEPQPLADGAALTGDGFLPLYRTDENETHFLVARAKPGVSRSAILQRFREIPRAQNIGTTTIPVEVDRLKQINRIPASIAALLGVLALLAVGHALVTAVRRRRSELALLKVLGFERRQVQATIAWQATTLDVVGAVIGIPAGIIIGRIVWQLVANGLGVSAEIIIPTWWLLLSVPAVLLIVNLIAFFPGRAAAATRPAVALREG